MDANRLNAQKSTGPATEEGRNISRLNAFKHGVYATIPEITGEDPTKLAEREQKYMTHFAPITVEEEFHVKVMAASEAEADRCALLEAAALKAVVDEVPEGTENRVGVALLKDAKGAKALAQLANKRERAVSRWVRSNKMFKQHRAERIEAETRQTHASSEPKPAATAPEPASPEPSVTQNRPETATAQPHPGSKEPR